MTEEQMKQVQEIVDERMKKFLNHYYEPMRKTLLKQVERIKELELNIKALKNKKSYNKSDPNDFFSTCSLHKNAHSKINDYLDGHNIDLISKDGFIEFLQSSEKYMNIWTDWRLDKDPKKKPKIFITKLIPRGLNAVRFGTQKGWDELKESPIKKEAELFFNNAPHVQLSAEKTADGYNYLMLNLRTGEEVVKEHSELVGMEMLKNGEIELGNVEEL